MNQSWTKQVSGDAELAAAIEDSGKAGEEALGNGWNNVDLIANETTIAIVEAHRPVFIAGLRQASRLIVDAAVETGEVRWRERKALS